MTCSCCPAKSKKEKLPPGWKRFKEQVYCAKCWRERYFLRAISIPISSPLDASWEELRQAVKQMWRLTTQCSNWMATELYAKDVRRNGEEKMPPMAHIYLYPSARERFPDLPPQTVASLEQAAQKKYKAIRYQTIWICARSLPTFSYPVPFPVHNQSWHPSLEDGKMLISIRIGERKWSLKLKGGARFRRQFQRFRDVARGDSQYGEAAIYEKGNQLMVKIVAWLPRPAKQGLTGYMSVKTGPDCILMAVNGKDETLWRYNGDQIRRWVAEHRKQLQRWSEDTKAELRPVPPFAERRKEATQKFYNRMHSACQMISAQLASYACARRFAELRYDDSGKSYCEQFQWAALKSCIEQKLDEVGIRFVASSNSEAKPQKPLATDQVQ